MSGRAMLRIDVLAGGDIDRALWSLSDVRLERRDGAVFVECDAAVADDARIVLARAGARASAAEAPPPRAGLHPARMADLEPLSGDAAIDTITMRALTVGEAARRPKRGLFGRRPGDDDRVRAILRGDDRAFVWRRIVWADRTALRSQALARARPIVFDREALAHGEERRAYASDRALARWIEG